MLEKGIVATGASPIRRHREGVAPSADISTIASAADMAPPIGLWRQIRICQYTLRPLLPKTGSDLLGIAAGMSNCRDRDMSIHVRAIRGGHATNI
jgi:hypothetical protein